MTKVLVTGASGFIGKNLIPELRSRHFEVLEFTHASGDVAKKSSWSGFGRVDVLIHLAGSTFVPKSWDDPTGFIENNLVGTLNALDYCRENNAKLVYLSSYLYGNPSVLPIPESASLIANNPYALSKKLAEEVCKFYSEYFGVKVAVFRPFNVYGEGQSEQFLIPSLIKQVRAGNAISVKDLEPKRDYVYIDDVVEIIIKAINFNVNFEIFNIGSGVSYSVSELIDVIQKIMGSNLNVTSQNERRPEEVMNTQADISKAKDILNWEPLYSLEQGLKKLIDR